MMEASIEEIAAFDLGGPGDIWETRWHWNCCPACRNEFPSLPVVLEQAGRKMEQVYAASLGLMKNHFLAEKISLATGISDGDVYPAMIAALAWAEEQVHSELHHALMNAAALYRGTDVEFDTWSRPLLSHCREFISSLEPDVQHFVFASTLSFGLLKPLWERIEPPDSRTYQEKLAELRAKLAKGPATESTQEPVLSSQERLRRAIADSGFEPKVLWETIDAAASAHVAGRETGGQWTRKFEEIFDNFDSIKATQMEQVRLSDSNIRKAADYGPEVAARVGTWLYSQLHESTQQQLNAAEFLYNVNRQEPRFGHGAVINLALACENELNLRLTWPIVNDLVKSGVETYPAGEKDGKQPERPLIAKGHIQDKNMAIGSMRWYLKFHADFRKRAIALGFDPDPISRDIDEVTKGRDKAAHRPVCELAEADKLRSLILRSDGILSRLHPGTTANCKI